MRSPKKKDYSGLTPDTLKTLNQVTTINETEKLEQINEKDDFYFSTVSSASFALSPMHCKVKKQ